MKSAPFFFTIFLSSVALCGAARGSSLTEETAYGSLIFIQTLNGGGDFGKHDENGGAPWSWNLGGTYQKTKTDNPGGAPIVDDTYSFNGSVNWYGDSGWGTGTTVDYSQTPAERLASRGINFSLSYLWMPSTTGDDDNDDFQPSLELKLTGGATNYLEAFNGQVPRRKLAPRPVSGTAELRQFLAEVGTIWQPLEKWNFEFDALGYFYNRDVVAFENQLDSPASIARGMSDFSDTIGGLPKVGFIADVSWRFREAWTLEFYENFSILAADSSASTITKPTIQWQFSRGWRLLVGVEWDRSNVITDLLAVAGLGWKF